MRRLTQEEGHSEDKTGQARNSGEVAEVRGC